MFSEFTKRLRSEFTGYNKSSFAGDLMAGVTVAAVALPLALAFGVSSGATAASGLITAVIAGIVITAFSGASYQISGPTGAMSAVLITIASKHGLNGVFIVGFIAGVMLLLAGAVRLGKLVGFIPSPVITGFTSGIAVIIALGQIDSLFGTVSEGETVIHKLSSYVRLGFNIDYQPLVIGVFVILLMLIWPKKWNARFPSSLAAIIAASVLVAITGFEVAAVGQIPKTLILEQRLSLSSINLAQLRAYISPAVTIAALGMIESLLCGASASRMKKESFDANQELIAQGIGNIILPFFGGVPATAAIARTSVAIKSGGQTRLTGIIHALVLLASMFLLAPVMSKLPLSALAGVLIMTAWRMNEWHAIKYIFTKRFKTAIAQFLVTLICTVLFDLTIAIIIGVVLAILIFVFNSFGISVSSSRVSNSKLKYVDHDIETLHGDTVVIYITGVLFFANSQKLIDGIKAVPPASKVIFSLRGVPGIDYGGAHALYEVFKELSEKNHSIIVCGACEKVKNTLIRVGSEDLLGGNSFFESVDRALLDGITGA